MLTRASQCGRWSVLLRMVLLLLLLQLMLLVVALDAMLVDMHGVPRRVMNGGPDSQRCAI